MSDTDEQREAEQKPAEEDLALEDEETEDVKGGKTVIRKLPPDGFEGQSGAGGTDTTLG